MPPAPPEGGTPRTVRIRYPSDEQSFIHSAERSGRTTSEIPPNVQPPTPEEIRAS